MDASRSVGAWGGGKRWLWLSVVGAGVLLFANASLLYGWLATPSGTRFLGLRTLLPADTPVYYSYLRQVQDGAVAVRDLYTAEPQPVGSVNVLWLTLGWLGKIFRLGPPATFHLGRFILGVPLLWLLYRAAAWFLRSPGTRLLAWLLMLGGGVGFALLPFLPPAEYLGRGAGYHFPVDLWLPWGYPVLSLGQSPHLAASWVLLVATVLLAASAVERRRWSGALWAGATAALLLNFHPYHWPTLLATPVVWFGLRWLNDRRLPLLALPYLVPLVAGTALSLAYHRWLLHVSPVISARALQNISRLPPWPYVIAGLGVVVPFALAGMLKLKHYFGAEGMWLVAWVVSAVALLSLPTQFQARYLQGILVPISVLAAPPLWQFGRWIARRWRWPGVVLAGTLVFALTYGSPVTLALRDVRFYQRSPASFYFPEEFFAAADFLRRTVPPGEPILASHDSALFIGAYVGRTLYFGHGDETVNSAVKRAVVERFYTTADPAVRREILRQIGVHYVWYGWFERQLSGSDLRGTPGSVPVFANDAVTILWFE